MICIFLYCELIIISIVIGSHCSEIDGKYAQDNRKMFQSDPLKEAFNVFDKDGKGAIGSDNFITMLESTDLINKRNHGKNAKWVQNFAFHRFLK